MHDDMQMIRQFEFEKCLFDGQLPCRWTPDLGYGYGLPLFNFYPPLPYIIGEFYRIIGFSFVNTIKLVAMVQFVLSAFFMYLLVKSIADKYSAIVASVFYTYAPYHAVNIYVRGAINEAWASVFFPLTFLFSKQLIQTKKKSYIFLLALSFSLILLSHNPMALVFFPALIIWSIYWIYQAEKLHYKKWLASIKLLFFSGIISLGLSAFFTIPSIYETSLVQIDKMFSGYYSYSNHFVSLYQLFISTFWGDGASIWGPNDGMSFSLGYLHWVIPILTFIIIIFRRLQKKSIPKSIYLFTVIAALAFAYTFLTHERSTFIWKMLPTLQKIQFPWRLLNISSFMFSIAAGLSVHSLKNSKKKLVCILLTIGVIIINFQHFYPITSGPLTDQQKFSGKAWEIQISGGVYDYLPKEVETVATKPASDYVDKIIPTNSQFTISGQKRGSNWQLFNLKLSQKSDVILPIIYFPNFQVKVNGESYKYSIEKEMGRIVLSLIPGDHQIYIKLTDTPIREISNYISLFTWLISFAYLFRPIWKRLISKK